MIEVAVRSKYYPLTERERVCRLAVELVLHPDGTHCMAVMCCGRKGLEVARMLEKLGLIPRPEDVLSHPECIERITGRYGRGNVFLLREVYPHLHLHHIDQTVCCDLPGPLIGWNHHPPIWWLGVEPKWEFVERVWERYSKKKSARSVQED